MEVKYTRVQGKTSAFHAEPPESRYRTSAGDAIGTDLQIRNFEHEHQGPYTCHASNSEGSTQATVFLHLSRSATIEEPLTNKTAVEGASVFWHCDATGQPSNITYRWQKDDVPLSSSEVALRSFVNGGEFGITSVKRSDRGWYTCSATNGFPPAATSSAYLDVQYKPEILSSNRQIYAFGIGSNGTIECAVDANPPATVVHWSRNGLALSTQVSNTTSYQLLNATAQDAGMYACRAENVIGASATFEIHVVVAPPPHFSMAPPPVAYVKAGEALETECGGFGDPPPTQYWLRNSKRISSSKLALANVTHDDQGLYQCFLSNAIATVSKDFVLYVQDTYPQCISGLKSDCFGEHGLRLFWEPGYDGGSTQSFRVLYRRRGPASDGQWLSIDSDNRTSAYTPALAPYSMYEFKVEASNEFGAINCSSLQAHSCQRLPRPSGLRLVGGNRLQWDAVHDAAAYKVAYRAESYQDFTELPPVTSSELTFDAERLRLDAGAEFYIQSVRPPFADSLPSGTLKLQTDSNAAMYALAGGCFLLFVFVLLVLVVRRHSTTSAKSKKKTVDYTTGGFGVYASDRKDSPYYQAYATAKDEDDTDVTWTLRSETQHGPRLAEFDETSWEENLDDTKESSSVVQEMLKQKYIYSPEHRKLDVIDELRIERLRREMEQTHV
ncbi:IGCM-2 protein [Aphelenchoides avenae]|nr:IGCM-2 protein [Aphelenchus avenae]